MNEPAHTSLGSFQPPIEDYAIVGDCRTAALISCDGSIGWLCLPDFSSPSIFGEILDRRTAGSFLLRPRDVFNVKRRYVSKTPILETMFETARGVVRLTDLIPVMDGVDALQPMREILRMIEGVAGELELEIQIDPRPNYGRTKPHIRHHGKLGWCYSWSNELLTVRSDIELERAEDALHAFVRVRAGERICLSLPYVKGDLGVLPPLGRDADERLERTAKWWRSWTEGCSYEGAYKEVVLRSALTLKLLSFSLSGAIVAAPTTSLPEAIGAERNWDYRYCWLRDAGLTMQAFIGLGFQDEGRSFLNWLLHATRLTWPELQAVYDVYGRTNLREQELECFDGYRGSKPVRIGNGAYSQHQLDVYGEVILAADAYVEGGGILEPAECRLLAGFGKVVCQKWREPDHGIWEIQGPPRQHTFSKVMCWLALDRLLKLGEKHVLSLGSLAERFRRERQTIAEVIEQRGFNSHTESYVSELDGNAVDSSLLLMPCIGYKSACDPRVVSTYERIRQRLGCNGLLYRYERG
ncbi:MAG: glycoside hydrolase family 15 protein, partial [Methylocella sp.]